MKKFEVLEAHQGDKFYKPGDEETGFRNAEPNEVQHLVDLGVLKVVGDADGPDDTPVLEDRLNAQPITGPEDAKTIADLRQQVETLTTEKDEAWAEVSSLIERTGNANAEHEKAQAVLKDERDAARAEVADLTKRLEAASEPSPATARTTRGQK